jgi:D-alanine-D-alanine ligase
VAIVFGGRSSEHAISCVSAGSVLRAIDRDRYDVVPIGIAPDGRWVLEPDEPERLAITDGRLPEVDAKGTEIVLVAGVDGSQLVAREPADIPATLARVDVVFPLLHGPFGEDGTLQGLLELADVKYVGSGVLASAVAMDKDVMKTLFVAKGLPVAPWVTVHDREWISDPEHVIGQVREQLTLPVFVKPARAGSSVGISKVADWSELGSAIDTARAHDPKVLVEAAVSGREIECGVLGRADGGAPDVSVPGEIRLLGGHDFYDFEAKYLDGSAALDIPADVPADVAARVRTLAASAFDALGCEGLARVDFFVDGDTVTLNEVNTMPGFTPTSMFPQLWAASGLDYPALVERLITTALARPTGLR